MSEPSRVASDRLRGVFPVVQMPYGRDDRVDHGALAHEVAWAIEQGVDGFAVAMVSEYLRLSDNERIAASQTTIEAAKGRPVVVSVGAESSFAACALATQAQDIGATAVMAIPPVSISVPESELAAYYEAIVSAVEVPVIVQDASGYVGEPMTIELQVSLLERFGERILFKPEAHPVGPRLTALRDATEGRAKVLEGSGGLALIDSFRRGIAGTMPAVDLCWAIVALWRALSEDDYEAAYAISGPLALLIAMQGTLDSFLAIEKHLLVRQGVLPNGHVRGPVAFTLDRETRDEVDRLFERLSDAVAASAPATL